jgi:flagella basal body P-ring formation protein FlgA
MKKRYSFFAMIFAAGIAPALADTQQAEGVRVVVPTHDIARGEVIAAADLVYGTIPSTSSLSGIATSASDLEGREARRFLRAGETVRTEDVRRPILVTKGSTVTMTFAVPGVSLTAIGRAVSEGGLGESVTVLNPVSYRQITCTVTGAGQVKAGDTAAVVTADAKP